MLLYIEDNVQIGQNVVAYLEADGYRVDWYTDGEKGLAAAQSGRYDCVILDIMVPGVDGIDICEQIRSAKHVPIIMTTAKGTISDKRAAYDAGADDYLTKPFDLAELVLRIAAIMKRSDSDDHITIGEFDIYLDENRVVRRGVDIALPLKERQLFVMLIDAQGRTVQRATIMSEIWGDDALRGDSDAKLDVVIAKLREKIGKQTIETIKGVGYRVVW